ncbi:MAG: hypothetical protein L3J83_12335 [Proteobacteria bacterium]|nr:hypothetical protein [Pseudomonadota bacterium]
MNKSIILIALFSTGICNAKPEFTESQFLGYDMAVENENIILGGATSIGSGFNYQGELIDAGISANGNYDFSFRLFNAESGGSQVGGTEIKGNRAVASGLFSIEDVDFGDAAYSGAALWLSVTVRETGNPGSEITLTPRQKIHAVPYAVQSEFGAGSSPWTVNGANINRSSGTVTIGSTQTFADLAIDATNDGDVVRVRVNTNTKFYVDDNGGTGVGSWTTPPTNGLRVAGDVKQPITSNGMMKYMAFVGCGGGSSITRQYNGVSTALITVAGSSVGRCIIDFPTDIDNRFWQVSVNFATATNSSGISRTANCRLESGSTDKLFCNITDPNVPAFRNGNIMVLVY